MKRIRTSIFHLAPLALAMLWFSPACGDEQRAAADYTTESLRGRVVFMADALERLHGVTTVADAKENTLVLLSSGGTLHPLIEDRRGHAFRLDGRLMGKPTELFVRRYTASPAIQVIRVYTIEDGDRYLVDYWCDICAIPLYELKPCDCCQGPIRLRKRKLNEKGEPIAEVSIPVEDAPNPFPSSP